MTVNDITLRSQQFAEGAREFQDQRRDQAYGQIGNTAQVFAQHIQHQQELEQHQMNLDREFAIQKADADARLSMQQQEMQMNSYKLQQMAAIDQVDMFKEQLNAMRLQNQATEFDLQQKQKFADAQRTEHAHEVFAKIAGSMSGLEWAAIGVKPNPTTYEFEKVEGKDRDALIETLKKATPNRDTTNPDRLLYDSWINSGDPELMEKGLAGQRAMASLPPRPKAPTAKEQQNQAEIEAKAAETAKTIRTGVATENPMNGIGDQIMPWGDSLKPESAEAIARYLWADADELVRLRQAGYDKDPARRGLTATKEDAIQWAVGILNNPNDPRRGQMLERLRKAGVIQ